MKYVISILLGAVLISALCFAAEPPEQRKEPTVAGETGAAIGAPTELRLKIVQNGFQLNWTPSPQDAGVVTGYEIVRTTVFSGPYETVGTVSKGTFSFVDKTAKPEAIYFYKVRAVAGSQYSPFSREASGEMPGRL
ncbi:MAG: fibronectin type III domain-containing protein [Desulfuromonadaceae bacterium]